MIWLAVAFGGALGAVIRYWVSLALPTVGEGFPWATLAVNVAGSALMGLFYILLVQKGIIGLQWRPFLMVGLLGALTTFSTFALDAVLLWQQGQGLQALLYVLASVITCIVAVAISLKFSQ